VKQVTNELTHPHIQTISSSDAYRNFIHSCRSPATVETYNRALKCFMDFLKIDRNAYDQLLQKDPFLDYNHSFILYCKYNIQNPLKSFNPCPQIICVRSYHGFILSFFQVLNHGSNMTV
jgi:hypothetical protein